ncbi:MAG TPA: arginine deiminase family protein [Terriglobia bacterium]|nr:arginine deiminase family protein [Terriglobia bacterium]
MVGPLRAVIVKRPEQAFRSSAAIQAEWKELGWTRPPNLEIASREHRQLVALLEAAGARVYFLPEDSRTNLDSIYVHDPVLITDAGAVILQTGKVLRRGEGPAVEDALDAWGIPILGSIEGGATAEAGDMIWLDRQTLLVGRGFRTNQAGIEWLSILMQPLGVSVIPVPLPYWTGPEDVLHLMSFMSLLDADLAVVYRRLLPVPLYELLLERGVKMVDVLEDEYASLGCNVLAIAPRQLLMVSGNPITRRRLEAAGCTVSEFEGSEICIPGAGGPTCITRPLLRG